MAIAIHEKYQTEHVFSFVLRVTMIIERSFLIKKKKFEKHFLAAQYKCEIDISEN